MTDQLIREIRIRSLPHGEYYSRIPSIHNMKKLTFDTPITFFVGENGSGKSTLLEAIALNLGFNAEGGSFNFNFSTKDTHSTLHEHVDLVKGYKSIKDGFFLRAESFYNVATYLEDVYKAEVGASDKLDGYGNVPHRRSHGQSFLDLINYRFRGNGIYLLDEPESALSPQNQLSAMIRIYELSKTGSQFVIVTHSPIITAVPNSTIYTFDDEGVHKVSRRETDSYTITEMMINNSDQVLRQLLKD